MSGPNRRCPNVTTGFLTTLWRPRPKPRRILSMERLTPSTPHLLSLTLYFALFPSRNAFHRSVVLYSA